ncbi:MAG: hypothetical protein HRU11_06080 [Parvularculaceae bacterium]|nr:hypothetical protein [Parvularculaceae bacterium]
MTWLTILLLIKIIGTLVTIAIPFLVLPKTKLDEIAGMGAPSLTFYRLYGVAILALLTAYASGVLAAQAGVFPSGIVAMGLVSNAGAVAAILFTGRGQHMVLSTVFFGSIAAGLALAFVLQDVALQQPF